MNFIQFVQHQGLPHSHEDTAAHKAAYGNEERKEHHGTDAVAHL